MSCKRVKKKRGGGGGKNRYDFLLAVKTAGTLPPRAVFVNDFPVKAVNVRRRRPRPCLTFCSRTRRIRVFRSVKKKKKLNCPTKTTPRRRVLTRNVRARPIGSLRGNSRSKCLCKYDAILYV